MKLDKIFYEVRYPVSILAMNVIRGEISPRITGLFCGKQSIKLRYLMDFATM